MKFTLFTLLVLVGCTKPNPAVCCLDEADCSEVGLGEVRSCSAGLACVEHQCEVPSCSMTGCSAAAPVCNITTDVCDPCADSDQCSRFADAPVCDATSGSCVGCVSGADCMGATPVCDTQTCRGCRIDSECPSGACGDDGACVAESAIAYLAPTGTDTGTCPRAAACRTLTFAVAQTSAVRNHIVMAPGAYSGNLYLTAQDTTATKLYIHGGGAGLTSASLEDSALFMNLQSVIRDLEISGPPSNTAITLYNGPHLIERVRIRDASIGIGVGTVATIRDTRIESAVPNVGVMLSAGAQLTMERTVISGGNYGVREDAFGAAVNMTNCLVWGAAVRALEIPNTPGTIDFSTFADSGADSGTGPRAVSCAGAMTIRNSIVWAPGVNPRVPIMGCNMVSTIAGPTSAAGAMNVDPMFVAPATNDYHLKMNSPARDAADTGPAVDFEGDARPRGVRFDLGADEAP